MVARDASAIMVHTISYDDDDDGFCEWDDESIQNLKIRPKIAHESIRNRKIFTKMSYYS